METHPGPEHSEHLPKHRVVQNGDPRDNKDLPSDRGVGHFHRLQGSILPHTNSQSVQEVHAFSHPGSVLPVQSPTLWSVHSTYGVHSGGQRGQTDVLPGQPLHPLKHALQIFTDASKEGWGAHLNERTARGTWSVPESKLHINHFLALKEFQDLCSNNIVLVATDNTTVVGYINKEGGMNSGSLCALLWRILSSCTRKQVTLKARHIPGRLNVIADKLSRLGQTIQTELQI